LYTIFYGFEKQKRALKKTLKKRWKKS